MRKRAFTLLETIIVLSLTVIIITFSFPAITRSQQVAAERKFWNSFCQEWQAAQVRSKVNHTATTVSFDHIDYQIKFAWIDGNQSEKKRIDIPETLLVREFTNFKMHENGYTKPMTQKFQSSINHKTYLMRIQLAWGGYHIETKE